MRRRRFFIVGAIIHFVIIIAHNIISTADGYHQVYGRADQMEQNHSIIFSLHLLTHHRIIAEYAQFSGTSTGFGFFASQVGSQYISQFKLFGADGSFLFETLAPHLTQQESMLRYSSFLDLFQEMLVIKEQIKQQKQNAESLDIRYARAVVQSLANQLFLKHETAMCIDVNVFLYRHPRLWDHKGVSAPVYINIYNTTRDKEGI